MAEPASHDRAPEDRGLPSLISVIVPVHNAADTLAEQLQALAGQAYSGPWELIIADNGSSDGSQQVADKWSDVIEGLRVVDASEKRGAAHARNVGAAAARGDLLVFCDADDVATPQWLDAMAHAARHADVVGGRLDHEALNDPMTRSWRLPPQPGDELPVSLRFLPAAASANLGIWSDAFHRLGGWREDYVGGYEDVELCWRAQLASCRLSFAPEAKILYRYRQDLRSLARQSFGFGMMAPKLFRDYRRRGMPPSPLRVVLGGWKRLLLQVPDLWGAPDRRAVWLRDASYRWGRVVGSVRYKVFYP